MDTVEMTFRVDRPFAERLRADPARLARLAALEAGEEGADPALRDVVRAVALRARIEVARRFLAVAAERSTTVP